MLVQKVIPLPPPPLPPPPLPFLCQAVPSRWIMKLAVHLLTEVMTRYLLMKYSSLMAGLTVIRKRQNLMMRKKIMNLRERASP